LYFLFLSKTNLSFLSLQVFKIETLTEGKALDSDLEKGTLKEKI